MYYSYNELDPCRFPNFPKSANIADGAPEINHSLDPIGNDQTSLSVAVKC